MTTVKVNQAIMTDVDELQGICVELDMRAAEALKKAGRFEARESFERKVWENEAREYLIMRHAIKRLLRDLEEFDVDTIKVRS